MKVIQRACNINAYMKSFHPCKRNIIYILVKTPFACILINNDSFILFNAVS
ncbi:hypothetical protein Hanom_Chr02g00160251 [Helianthus anomalus]